MSPSITYWNRLEPSPRSNDLMQALAAGVADGLWCLTRQWQLGEFEGADAGSPAWIEVDTTTRRMTEWRAGDASGPIEPHIPLETTVGERLPLDLETRVDLGQMFELMLIAANLAAAIPTFRATYPIAPPSAREEASGDVELIRLRGLVAGRAIDGGALYEAVAGLTPVIVDPLHSQIPLLLQEWVTLVGDYFGGVPAAPSPAWNPQRLAYQFDVSIGNAGGFEVRPGDDGEVTWDAFSSSDFLSAEDSEPPAHDRITLLPASVRQRRLPSGPWWNFDHAAANVGAIDAERRDVAKLVLMDLLIAPGDDWYVIPIEQVIGTVMHLDAVCVRDVFGLLTLIPPAAGDQGPWSMFTTSGPSSALGLLLPAGSGAANQFGQPLEEIRFVRDEMMNMVWAIEETIEGGTGQPLSVYERAARRAAADGGPAPSRYGESMPRYLLRTATPEQRIPFVPAVRGAGGALLERAGNGATGVLTVSSEIAEEELRRTGLRVMRVPARCRGAHGETLVRVACMKNFSPRRDSPAPRFDALVPGSGDGILPVLVSGQVAFIQSSFGVQGDFEVIVPLESGGLACYSRDNDAEGFPWREPAIFAIDTGIFESVSLIQSTFVNLEIVARTGDRLAHFWRDATTQQWNGPNFFASGVSGTVSLIQSSFGSPGNFEVVAPLATGGIAHFWRDNHNFAWSGANAFAENGDKVDDVCLIQGSFGGNLELVARIGDRLAHFWRDTATQQWNGPAFFASGISGTPSFIQNRSDTSANFEVVAPVADGGLAQFSRNNSDPELSWSGPVRFGSGTVRAIALIQSNFGNNLEVVALAAVGLVHYWRESTQPFAWHGPGAINP